MNSVQLIGRLVRDPDVRYTSGTQTAVASFTIAIDRPQRQDNGEKQADFPRITVFGRQAETCEKYLKKGRLVAVQGRIQTGSYQNKNGDTVYTTDVVANRVEFIDWGDRQQGGFQGGPQSGYQSRPSAPQEEQQAPAPTQAEAPAEAPAPAQAEAPAGGQESGNQGEMPDSFEAIDEDVPF